MQLIPEQAEPVKTDCKSDNHQDGDGENDQPELQWLIARCSWLFKPFLFYRWLALQFLLTCFHVFLFSVFIIVVIFVIHSISSSNAYYIFQASCFERVITSN